MTELTDRLEREILVATSNAEKIPDGYEEKLNFELGIIAGLERALSIIRGEKTGAAGNYHLYMDHEGNLIKGARDNE